MIIFKVDEEKEKSTKVSSLCLLVSKFVNEKSHLYQFKFPLSKFLQIKDIDKF